MTKKQVAPEVIEPVEAGTTILEQNENASAARERAHAVDRALDHHRINGGMLTVAQLIENAKQFHAYITGENK